MTQTKNSRPALQRRDGQKARTTQKIRTSIVLHLLHIYKTLCKMAALTLAGIAVLGQLSTLVGNGWGGLLYSLAAIVGCNWAVCAGWTAHTLEEDAKSAKAAAMRTGVLERNGGKA